MGGRFNYIVYTNGRPTTAWRDPFARNRRPEGRRGMSGTGEHFDNNPNEKRGLGIPVMADRALQALGKQALEPEWEAVFEANSYGFRPGRSAHWTRRRSDS